MIALEALQCTSHRAAFENCSETSISPEYGNQAIVRSWIQVEYYSCPEISAVLAAHRFPCIIQSADSDFQAPNWFGAILLERPPVSVLSSL